jgi:hypothetical protein
MGCRKTYFGLEVHTESFGQCVYLADIEALPEADRVAVRDAYRARSAALGPYRPAGAPPHPADGGE